MSGLSNSSRNVTEVTIQHWPHTKQCQYYYTQHTYSLSQSQPHCTDATVDEQTDNKTQCAINALSPFSGCVSTIISDVVVIFFSSTAVLTQNGNFSVLPLLHSVSDIISQFVAVLLATTAPSTFLSLHARFH